MTTSFRWSVRELDEDGEPTARWYGWACGSCGESQMTRHGFGSIFRYGIVAKCRRCGASLLDAEWRRLG